MTTILHIDSSLFSHQGASSTLAAEFVSTLQSHDPEARVIHRDLAREPIPHLDIERLTAIGTAPGERNGQQRAIAAEADGLIAELQAADVLVLGVPMYNFAIPSQLKAWLDHVARAGVTFRYTEHGPEGLLNGKRAVIFTSRGGLHHGAATDTMTPFLRTLLGFLGIDDVKLVYAEGLNLGDQRRADAMAQATGELQQVAAQFAVAA